MAPFAKNLEGTGHEPGLVAQSLVSALCLPFAPCPMHPPSTVQQVLLGEACLEDRLPGPGRQPTSTLPGVSIHVEWQPDQLRSCGASALAGFWEWGGVGHQSCPQNPAVCSSKPGCAPVPASEPSAEPQSQECLQLLEQLHGSTQQLWAVTEESLRSLQERLCHPDLAGLESLLLLRHVDRVLQVHME